MNALVFIPCFRPASKAASASGVAVKLLSIGLESGEVSGCLFFDLVAGVAVLVVMTCSFGKKFAGSITRATVKGQVAQNDSKNKLITNKENTMLTKVTLCGSELKFSPLRNTNSKSVSKKAPLSKPSLALSARGQKRREVEEGEKLFRAVMKSR